MGFDVVRRARLKTAAQSKTLIVGHADEAGLLAWNLTHHFAIGFTNVVVVTTSKDAGAAAVVRRFDRRHVFHYVLDELGGDLLNFFSPPARWAIEHFESEWLAFCDTDEFIVAASGSIRTTKASEDFDMVAIPRYTVLPQSDRDGTLVDFDFSRPAALPIAGEYFDIKAAWMAGDRSVPYILARDAPKTLARAKFIDAVLPGGHGIVTAAPFVKRSIDQELAIAHFPFTSLARFARKIDAIRAIIALHGDTVGREIAWHWRSWAALDEAGVREEFERQIRAVSGAASQTTLEAVFSMARDPLPPASPHAFAMLKTMVEYLEPVVPVEIPQWVTDVFDPSWYLEHYDDVREGYAAGILDPFEHFVHVGIAQGRSPSRHFDPHFMRKELERYTGSYLELRDVYWLYFSLPDSERPATAAVA